MSCIVPAPSTGPRDPAGEPILDLRALRERCFGDLGLEADLLELFAEQCHTVGTAVLTTVDPGALRDAAHALRGSAAAVGARALSAALAAIEEGGRDAGEARTVLPSLLDRTRAAVADRLASAPLAKPGGLA